MSATSTSDRSEPSGGSTSLFTRQATGLVKEIRTRDAFNINMGVANPGLALPVFGFALALYPNSDLTLPLIVAGVCLLFLVAVYTQLVAAMPRSGGDYVFVGRILSPVLGASVGGAWLVMLVIFGAIGAHILGSQFIPAVFSNLGQNIGSHTLQTWATSLSGKWGTFLGGSVFVIALGALTCLGPRFTNRLLMWSLVGGIIGLAITIGLLLFNSPSDFVNAFHANNPALGHAGVIATATKEGWHPGTSFSGTFGVLPYAILLYAGFSYSGFAGGEIRRPAVTYARSVIFALGACTFIFVLVWLLARHTMGFDFLSSAMFLGNKGSTALAATPSISTYAGYLTGSWVLGLLVTLSFVAWAALYIVSYFVILSRIIFAFAFDRILPTRAASVVESSGAPVVATVAVIIALIAALAVSTFTEFLAVWTNGTLTLMIAFVVASIAAALLPYRRRELYEAGAKVLRFKIAGMPAIVVIASINAALFVALAIVVIRQSSVFGPISVKSIGFTVISFAWGAAAFAISRMWNNRHGISMDLALKELPPE